MTDAPTPRDVIADYIAVWAPMSDPHHAGDILADLLSAGYVVERGWQPIETAPRDGTRVLCYAPAAEGRASLVRNDYWWVQERGFAHMRPDHPYTHWRPLPAAPTTKEDAP